MHLQSSYLHNSGEGEKLIEHAVGKASGVFLWFDSLFRNSYGVFEMVRPFAL